MQNSEEWEIPPFDFVEFMGRTNKLFGLDVYNWISYVLIYVALIYIYLKVFQANKLPILKAVIVYAIIAVGAFVLLIFQTDAGLPILYSLLVAVSLMLIVRIRYWLQGRK